MGRTRAIGRRGSLAAPRPAWSSATLWALRCRLPVTLTLALALTPTPTLTLALALTLTLTLTLALTLAPTLTRASAGQEDWARRHAQAAQGWGSPARVTWLSPLASERRVVRAQL